MRVMNDRPLVADPHAQVVLAVELEFASPMLERGHDRRQKVIGRDHGGLQLAHVTGGPPLFNVEPPFVLVETSGIGHNHRGHDAIANEDLNAE